MAGVGATLAGGLLWLLVTFLLGRVYCSAFCPLGVLQDGVIRLRSLFGRKRRRFSYRKSNNRRFLMLGIYAGAMVAAIGSERGILPWTAPGAERIGRGRCLGNGMRRSEYARHPVLFLFLGARFLQ